jgi:hypothetical protein
MKLGGSQHVVFDLLHKYKWQPTSQEVGDKLYEKTSECFINGQYGMGGKATPAQIRRNWAAKLLNELKKKGLCGMTVGKTWYLTEAGWTLAGENE